MHLALSAVASRLNLDVLAKLPELQAPKVPPPPPEPLAELAISAKSMAQLDDDWCGTKVPRPFPGPLPLGHPGRHRLVRHQAASVAGPDPADATAAVARPRQRGAVVPLIGA